MMLTRLRAMLRRDDGVSLAELLVAMSIFGVLMALVAAGVFVALRTISSTSELSQLQREQENAALWMARELRYLGAPTEGAAAIESATATEVTFYSYSGSALSPSVARKVTIEQVPACSSPGAADCDPAAGSLRAMIWEPQGTVQAPTYPTQPTSTRILLPADDAHAPSVTMQYVTDWNPDLTPIMASDSADTPTAKAIRFTITDQKVKQQLTQDVAFTNGSVGLPW